MPSNPLTKMVLLIYIVTIAIVLAENHSIDEHFPHPPCFNLDLGNETVMGPHGRIILKHPAIETENGYFPGLIYQVSIELELEDGLQARYFVIRAVHIDLGLDAGGLSIPNNNSSKCIIQIPPLYQHPPPSLLSDDIVNKATRGNSTGLRVGNLSQAVEWKTPNTTNPGCIDIIAYIIGSNGSWFFVTHPVCPREEKLLVVTSLSGTVSFGSTTKSYPDNMSYIIILPPREGRETRVQFQYLDIEPFRDIDGQCFDYVGVGSTEVEATKTSSHYCGKYTAEALKDLSFVSDGNFVVMKFVSDDKIGGAGFSALFYYVSNAGASLEMTGTSGIISSSGFPNEYLPNYHRVYTIKAPRNYRISLVFKTFLLQERVSGVCLDYIATETVGPRHGIKDYFCGNKIPTFTSSFNWFRLTFHTDYLIQRTGFRAQYTRYRSCENSTYENPNGSIVSRGYPGPYLNNQLCYITIKIPNEDMRIEIQFDLLQTEAHIPTYLSGEECTEDYVEVYTGNKTMRLCGDWRPKLKELNFKSVDQVLTIKFVTDYSDVEAGFSMRWISIKEDVANMSCPIGWRNGMVDSCYYVESMRRDWKASDQYCNAMGGHLLIVNGLNEEEIITQLIRESGLDEGVFWIGASDQQYEADFYWVDGSRVSYTDWFPGWPRFAYHNRQPNDDGLSEQDCVELRRTFAFPSKGQDVTNRFYWNDRECQTENMFICEKEKQSGLTPEPVRKFKCLYEIKLTLDKRCGVLTSPGFPRKYTEDVNCTTIISAPDGYLIEMAFTHFEMEESDRCQYDRIVLSSSSVETNIGDGVKTICGDWNSRLKLLTYISTSNELHLQFLTDHSNNFIGFKAHYCLQNASRLCPDRSWRFLDDRCYRINLVENLTRSQAKSTCLIQGGNLANVSMEHQISNILASSVGNVSLWAGYPRVIMTENLGLDKDRCASVRFGEDGSRYAPCNCDEKLSFVCEMVPTETHRAVEKHVVDETSPWIASPGYPLYQYQANSHIIWEVSVSDNYYIQFIFEPLRLEYQEDCLYDYISLANKCTLDTRRMCGNWLWLSYTVLCNSAIMEFVSDYDTLLSGFNVTWKKIAISLTLNTTLFLDKTNIHGIITSPNYPVTYTNDLNKWIIITAKEDRRVWMVIDDLRLNVIEPHCSDYLVIFTEEAQSQPNQICSYSLSSVRGRVFLSEAHYSALFFHTNEFLNAPGFKIKYRTVPKDYYKSTKYIHLDKNDTGKIFSINHPYRVAPNIDYQIHIESPLGTTIQVQVLYNNLTDTNYDCDNNFMEITDPTSEKAHRPLHICQEDSPFMIESNMHVLGIRTRTGQAMGVAMENYIINYQVTHDPEFVNKTVFDVNVTVGDCLLQPCHNDGHCIEHRNGDTSCVCRDIFTGLVCRWTYCDQDPCINGGRCTNQDDGYRCVCPRDFGGNRCEINLKRCGSDKCSGQGKCIFKENWKLECACEYEYHGTFCELERNAQKTPAGGIKLLDEPFWIGIIVVTCVLILTALFIFIKKKCQNYYDVNCCEQTDTTKNDKYVYGSYGYGNNGYIPESNPQSPEPSADNSMRSSPKGIRSDLPVIRIQGEATNRYLNPVYPTSENFIDEAADIIVPQTADIINVTSRLSQLYRKQYLEPSSMQQEEPASLGHVSIDTITMGDIELLEEDGEAPDSVKVGEEALTQLAMHTGKLHLDRGSPPATFTHEHRLDLSDYSPIHIHEGSDEGLPSFRFEEGKLSPVGSQELLPRRKNSSEKRKDFAMSVRKSRKCLSSENLSYCTDNRCSSSMSYGSCSREICPHCRLSLNTSNEEGQRNYFSKSCELSDSDRSTQRSLSGSRCSHESEYIRRSSTSSNSRNSRKMSHRQWSRGDDLDSCQEISTPQRDEFHKYSSYRTKRSSHGDNSPVELRGIKQLHSRPYASDQLAYKMDTSSSIGSYRNSSNRTHKRHHHRRKSHHHGDHLSDHHRLRKDTSYNTVTSKDERRHSSRYRQQGEGYDHKYPRCVNGTKHEYLGISGERTKRNHRKLSPAYSDSAVEEKKDLPNLHSFDSVDKGVRGKGVSGLYFPNSENQIYNDFRDNTNGLGNTDPGVSSPEVDVEVRTFSSVWNPYSRQGLKVTEDELLYENNSCNQRFHEAKYAGSGAAEHSLISKYPVECDCDIHSDEDHGEYDAATIIVNAEVHSHQDKGKANRRTRELGRNKHPLQDSAYQSKVQSTDRNNSKPDSDIVSPKQCNDSTHSVFKFVPTRMEDKRVVNLLERAAKKLAALDESRQTNSHPQSIGEEDDVEIGALTAIQDHQQMSTLSVSEKHIQDEGKLNKTKRVWPSRVLSMIMDEGESENSDTGGRNTAINPVNRYPTVQITQASFEEGCSGGKESDSQTQTSTNLPESRSVTPRNSISGDTPNSPTSTINTKDSRSSSLYSEKLHGNSENHYQYVDSSGETPKSKINNSDSSNMELPTSRGSEYDDDNEKKWWTECEKDWESETKDQHTDGHIKDATSFEMTERLAGEDVIYIPNIGYLVIDVSSDV